MAKVKVNIAIDYTKPDIAAEDLANIITWIQTNITDKLPENAAALYTLTYTP